MRNPLRPAREPGHGRREGWARGLWYRQEDLRAAGRAALLRAARRQRQRRVVRHPVHLRDHHSWLIAEKAKGIPGNFLCNWSSIERAHQSGGLLVFTDGKLGAPVAFQLGGLVEPGILQVKSSHQGQGIGKKMVERCVTLARKRKECLLRIQCEPPTSIPFWQRMGFTIDSAPTGEVYAYRVLEAPLVLPDAGTAAHVMVRFYPESRMWVPETQPYAEFSPQAKLAANGDVHLAQRVLFHEDLYPRTDRQDLVVEIEVNGQRVYRDKAKYGSSRKVGVKRCMNGYYLDRVVAPPA